MDAVTSSNTKISIALQQATYEANEWRGRCVNLFARAERALNQALLSRAPDTKPPMLVGKKIERIEAIGLPDEALTAVQSFGALLPDRAPMAHGIGKLRVEDQGWTINFRWLSGTTWQCKAFTADETKRLHRELRTSVRQLERALESVIIV